MGKRELVALLSLSFRCIMMVVWLFLVVPGIYAVCDLLFMNQHTCLLTRHGDSSICVGYMALPIMYVVIAPD